MIILNDEGEHCEENYIYIYIYNVLLTTLGPQSRRCPSNCAEEVLVKQWDMYLGCSHPIVLLYKWIIRGG